VHIERGLFEGRRNAARAGRNHLAGDFLVEVSSSLVMELPRGLDGSILQLANSFHSFLLLTNLLSSSPLSPGAPKLPPGRNQLAGDFLQRGLGMAVACIVAVPIASLRVLSEASRLIAR
jgi:hypothetical protein